MLSLHQLTCFLATVEQGSLTAAAEELGYAQPSVSEQIRALEKTLGVELFRRVGRGVVPTEAAEALRPHAERTLASAAEARKAVQDVRSLETGTIRFGMFGIARHYIAATLVNDVLDRHPNVQVELVGLNSTAALEQLARGYLEAALIAVPQLQSAGLEVTPVARDELVYVSAHPERLTKPITAKALSRADLVMSEATFRAEDSVRIVLRRMLHETGYNPRIKVEVEAVETAIELAGAGRVDTVVNLGAARVLLPELAPNAGWVSLRPRQYDALAIVHRRGATLSPAARLMIELATTRIRTMAEPI